MADIAKKAKSGNYNKTVEDEKMEEAVRRAHLDLLINTLGAQHNKLDSEIEDLPHQRKLLQLQSSAWLWGSTNKGKTFCVFQILKREPRFALYKHAIFEDMFRKKFTGQPWTIPKCEVIAVDDIDKINLGGDGMQNEVWRWFDEMDTYRPKKRLIITSQMSIRRFVERFGSNLSGSLESRLRRLIDQEIEVND